jgi:hypothetical protein
MTPIVEGGRTNNLWPCVTFYCDSVGIGNQRFTVLILVCNHEVVGSSRRRPSSDVLEARKIY